MKLTSDMTLSGIASKVRANPCTSGITPERLDSISFTSWPNPPYPSALSSVDAPEVISQISRGERELAVDPITLSCSSPGNAALARRSCSINETNGAASESLVGSEVVVGTVVELGGVGVNSLSVNERSMAGDMVVDDGIYTAGGCKVDRPVLAAHTS